MRFSRNWIGSYTELPGSDRELEEALSSLGLVVDAADSRGDDVSLDLDVASNRPDVMNHLGVAAELALLRGTALDRPDSPPLGDGPPTASIFALDIRDPGACPRFVAEAIVDVEVGASPAWLVERLESIGLRPINAVVDITNFVMWELGRPMHAYDLDKLDGSRLEVRFATPGEKLVTLDEVERELTPADLVIADGSRAVGLAGLMGGHHTGVTESTRRVLLECATFDPATVRAMARRHGMHTDASHRFERGLSHAGILEATRRATALVTELCGGKACGEALEVAAEMPERAVLEMPVQRVADVLGVKIEPDRIVEILRGLSFDARVEGDDLVIALAPTRLDVTRDVDVIEEIARFHGYENLPDTLPLLRRSRRAGAEPPLRREAAVRELCVGLGYWQAMTLVFSSVSEQTPFSDADRLVELANPLNEAMSRLRGSLTPGLLAVVARNLNVGAEGVRLFEIGRVFGEPAEPGAPVERRHLAILGAGLAGPRHHLTGERRHGFADLKGALETIASRMGWPTPEWAAQEVPGFQPGSTAGVRCGDGCGYAGRVDPDVAARFGIEHPVWALELDIDRLLHVATPSLTARHPARFPASQRDVTLLVPETLSYGEVETAVRSVKEAPLETLALIGLYRGEDIPEGQLAMTLRLTFRSRERTLTADEVESALETILARLADAGAVRR